MIFSEKLQLIRRNKGLTQEELAQRLSVSRQAVAKQAPDLQKLIEFRLEANVNTYAACMNETAPTRLDPHDFTYSNGPYTYHDTYVGGEQFAGEEAVSLI